MLFSIEVLLIAMSVGTAVAGLLGAHGYSLAGMICCLAILMAGLLSLNFIRVVRANRLASLSDDRRIDSRHWAYRLKSECVAAAIDTGNSALAAEESDISDQLDLEAVDPRELRVGDVVLVEAGQTIFAEGMVVAGAAIVDESAVSGQSSRVVRWAFGEPAVMRDSRVVEGKILVQVIPRRGHPLDWLPDDAMSPRHMTAAN